MVRHGLPVIAAWLWLMLPLGLHAQSVALWVSTSADRSAAEPLDGAVLSDDAYIFVAPEEGITRVRFYFDHPDLNGSPVQTENYAPYDFAGTLPDMSAKSFDTHQRPNGAHIVSARVEMDDGPDEILEAAVVIDNEVVTLSYELVHSAAPQRDDPQVLDGAVLSGDAYVFLVPERQVERVLFYVDDPAFDDAPVKIENRAPFDLAGTGPGPDKPALPYDTTALGDGTHEVTARAWLDDGSVVAVTSTFDVDNIGDDDDDDDDDPPPALVDQVHLSWPDDPATTMTVQWRTTAPDAPSALQYRADPDDEWLTADGTGVPGPTGGVQHRVDLTDLQPGQAYSYRVGLSAKEWSTAESFTTAPDGAGDFRAVFLADTGIAGRADGLTTGTTQVIAEIAARQPTVMLMGGDYAYYDTDTRYAALDEAIDAWIDQMAPIARAVPLMPAYGNHEIYLGENYEAWAARLPAPAGYGDGRHYSFDVGDVHFVALTAAESHDPLPKEVRAWLENDLAEAVAAERRWIIPYLHVAPYTDGTNHPPNQALRTQLGPLFEAYGVRVVLTAHDQSFERSWPLVDMDSGGAVTSFAPDCYTLEDGVTWVKVSPGGKLSNINGSFSPFGHAAPPFWTAVRDNTHHHFAVIDVSENDLRVETYGVAGDGTPAVLQDAFRYTLDACPPIDDTTYELLVSTSADRSDPQPLADGVVSGMIYVFVNPETNVDRVLFYIDNEELAGAADKIENNPPFDLAGTNLDGSLDAEPFDSAVLSNGTHTISTVLEFFGGGTEVVHTTFTVENP